MFPGITIPFIPGAPVSAVGVTMVMVLTVIIVAFSVIGPFLIPPITLNILIEIPGKRRSGNRQSGTEAYGCDYGSVHDITSQTFLLSGSDLISRTRTPYSPVSEGLLFYPGFRF
jgi:hypothetical protein